MRTLIVACVCVFFFFLRAVGGQARRHVVRQLPDDHHHAVEAERQRRPRVQRLRTLLQAAQCKFTEIIHPPPKKKPPRALDVFWGGGVVFVF